VICCPLTSSDGEDGPSCSTTKVRTARKVHRCCECREDITVGTKYEYVSGIWDGRPGAYKTCLSCVEIRDHFACEGYIYGQLWEDLEENFFPEMKAGGPCMEGLSPEAKARLFDLRLLWLEENCDD
jgi:hypothetical protein